MMQNENKKKVDKNEDLNFFNLFDSVEDSKGVESPSVEDSKRVDLEEIENFSVDDLEEAVTEEFKTKSDKVLDEEAVTEEFKTESDNVLDEEATAEDSKSEYWDDSRNNDYYHNLSDDYLEVIDSNTYCYENDPVFTPFVVPSKRYKDIIYDAYNNLFSFENLSNNQVILTGLRVEPYGPYIYIPEKLNGRTITALGSNFLKGFETKVKGLFLSNVRVLKSNCFTNSNLEFLENQGELRIIDSSAFEGCRTLRDLTDCKLSVIKSKAFKGCVSLETLDFSEVEQVGQSAFEDCISLKSANLTDVCKAIGVKAFFNCRDLQEVYLGKALKGVDCKCFEKCWSLKDIKFAETQDNESFVLGLACFKQCYSLTTIELPDYVTDINGEVFMNCANLKGINLNQVRTLGDKAFYKCINLERVKIPNSVLKVGSNCFAHSGLQKVKFKCSQIRTLREVFKGCKELYEVSLPKYVEDMTGCFIGCTNLSEVKLPESVKVIDNLFYKCSDLEKFKIPYSVKRLNKFTFGQCKSLNKVSIPPNVKSISKTAFLGVKDCLIICVRQTEGEKFAQRSHFNYQYLGDGTIHKAEDSKLLQNLRIISSAVYDTLRDKFSKFFKNTKASSQKNDYLNFKV